MIFLGKVMCVVKGNVEMIIFCCLFFPTYKFASTDIVLLILIKVLKLLVKLLFSCGCSVMAASLEGATDFVIVIAVIVEDVVGLMAVLGSLRGLSALNHRALKG